ncbi:MAG TPA: amidohydrolase family protein [Chthoniobacteraceae bacterium]|nr:amidohydrolase family protein [Chthoniobacteraceae bacterium]
MILDVHAHYWPDANAFAPDTLRQAERARGGPVDLVTDYADYWAHAPEGTRVIVFGGKARLSGFWQEDDIVARFAASDPERVIGFLTVDLSQPGWMDELERGHRDLGLRGVKLLPMYAGFYPHDRKFDPFWQYVSRHRLPVLLHTGTTFISQAPLDCTLPRHLDEVAIRFPEAVIIMAHLGHPYEGEAIVIARKHPHVYTDLSALHYRPWQLFHSLMLVGEYHVWPKILFGTDYPFTNVNETIEGLKSLCQREMGGFRLPEDEIEAVIHRDSYPLLFG